MKVLLFRLDGRVTEFEVRGSPPHFILVDHKDDKTTETLFHRLVDFGGSSIGQYAEHGINQGYFLGRSSAARQKGNYEYGKEMDYMASIVARPDFPPPIGDKVERYSSWVPKTNMMPIKPDPMVEWKAKIAELQSQKAILLEEEEKKEAQKKLLHDIEQLKILPPIQQIKKYNTNDWWDPPYQNTYIADSTEDKPFTNITYTPKPTVPPPPAPDVIGEPKKRLILIKKEENESTDPTAATSDPS